jgi:hypothetical protein
MIAYASSPVVRGPRTPTSCSYDSGVDISSLLPTPSPATTAAREIVVRYSSAALVNHCERSYFWSASLGRLKRIAYDAELLYVASMLHDLGLVPAFDNHLAPFEDAGGDVGWVFGAGAGWPAERRDRVEEIIFRHMWDEVDPALDAEGHLLREGTALDISGHNVDTWPADFRAEVLRRCPRLTLVTEFTAAFKDQARRNPAAQLLPPSRRALVPDWPINPLDSRPRLAKEPARTSFMQRPIAASWTITQLAGDTL